ncbi:MAG: Rqc2 family fibronectin-binding protein [Desulfitobacteriaceae bacterium]
MALDGVTLSHLVTELAPRLAGARIDKIQQPEKDEIHLTLRQQGQSLRLLLNAGATGARLHLTTENKKKNPATPPMFCMILRKHLEGGKILELSQAGLERIITLNIQNYNEYGDLSTWHLTLEIMGKHSNLLLIDPASNIILDGLRRYSRALSRHREVLPGRPYILPPSQGKIEYVTTEEQFRQIIYSENLERKLVDIVLTRFGGISPELALETVLQADLESKTLLQECGEIDLARLYQAYTRLDNPQGLQSISPHLYFSESRGQNGLGIPVSFTFIPFQQYQGLPSETLLTLNETVSQFYQRKTSKNTIEAKRGSLLKIVQEFRAHSTKKLNIYEDTLASARESLRYQKWGELLTANLYNLKLGMSKINVEDYYDPNLTEITIPLDPFLNGIENAQRFYKLYTKAKTALQRTEPLRTTVLAELAYLDSLLVSLNQAADPEELEEIHSELIEQGYILGKTPTKKASPKKKLEVPIRPRAFRSSQNRVIFVGKNNRQNDWLTLRKARAGDLWLHVKNIPGSHVLIPLNEGEEFPDDATLEEAALLAIHFSQARGSSQVPVDYTHARQIKKPNAAKPGMVIYEQNWTLYLTPQPEVLDILLGTESN